MQLELLVTYDYEETQLLKLTACYWNTVGSECVMYLGSETILSGQHSLQLRSNHQRRPAGQPVCEVQLKDNVGVIGTLVLH